MRDAPPQLVQKHALDLDIADEIEQLLGAMTRARVVTMEAEQLDALPELTDLYSDLTMGRWEVLRSVTLPFPSIYISILPTSGGKWSEIISGFAAFSEPAPRGPTPLTIVIFGGEPPFPKVMLDSERGWIEVVKTEPDEREGLWGWLVYGGERALAALYFLESANVFLAQPQVSRQVRRVSERTETPIAQRVYVRAPTRRSRSDESGPRREYSHRFEVRGHYRHFGASTRLYRAVARDRPEKLLDLPSRGSCVRIWCPPFVKGPVDKPLVVKSRTLLAGKRDAALAPYADYLRNNRAR
jgi:hypothetical protein